MQKFIGLVVSLALGLSLILISCRPESSLKSITLPRVNSSLGAISYTNGKFLGNVFTSEIIPLDYGKLWDQVTPADAGKWGSVEGVPNIYIWNTLDDIYNYAKSKGMLFKYHNIIWGQQQPSWITTLSTTDQKLAIIAWISNIGARYSNMDFVEVVNEPINTPPFYMEAMGGDGSTGWDWIVFAFKQARKYCGSAKLLINEYNVDNNPETCAKYTNIIMILKASNLIDGVETESHDFSLDGDPTDTLSNCLAMMAATGLPIFVSELDLSNRNDAVQESLYKEYFPILWNYPAIKGITLWGYIESYVWTPDAWLITSRGKPRPAFIWLTNYIKNH
jgi:endo-1,4-beta-xylanase